MSDKTVKFTCAPDEAIKALWAYAKPLGMVCFIPIMNQHKNRYKR